MTQPAEPTPAATTESETPTGETDFEPIVSKQQLDKIIGAARKADKQRLAELQPKAAKYEELERAKKTQAEQDADRITKLESELEKERAARNRDSILRTILREKGLPDEASEFIHGNDREEIEASAERFQSLHGPEPKPKPRPGQLKSSFGSDTRMNPMEKAATAMREFRKGSGN